MAAPLISVVVPNYNHERFLAQRLDSIINQTYQNIEIIILDDCSTDNSRDLIIQYANRDKRIKYLWNKKNSGSPFRQWKKGTERARGEYIWIAESDDYADTRFLEVLFSFLQANPSAAIAYCQSRLINYKGESLGSHYRHLHALDPNLWNSDFYLDGKTIISKYMIIMNVIPNASAVLMRKSALKCINWDAVFSYHLAGDRMLWVQILKEYGICFVNRELNYFRMDGNTVRSKYMFRPTYLRENLRLMSYMSSVVNVARQEKWIALKYWLRLWKKARKKGPLCTFYFDIKVFPLFIRALLLYFKNHKIPES